MSTSLMAGANATAQCYARHLLLTELVSEFSDFRGRTGAVTDSDRPILNVEDQEAIDAKTRAPAWRVPRASPGRGFIALVICVASRITSKGTPFSEKLATFPCEIVIETGQGYVPPSVPFQVPTSRAAVRHLTPYAW